MSGGESMQFCWLNGEKKRKEKHCDSDMTQRCVQDRVSFHKCPSHYTAMIQIFILCIMHIKHQAQFTLALNTKYVQCLTNVSY